MTTLYKRIGIETMELLEKREEAKFRKTDDKLIITVNTKYGNKCEFYLEKKLSFCGS